MELLYIWIEDYKNIRKQGFNLSPRWWFDYNPENGQLKVEDRREEALDDFFGEDIINITAIVGKNGSGKTSLLDYIWSNIKDGTGLYLWNARMVLIYLDREENVVVLYHSSIDKPTYKGNIDLNIMSFPKNSTDLTLPLDNMKFIYYSDVFDSLKPDSRSWDLTTSGLIARAWEDYSNGLNYKGEKDVFKNFLESYQILEYQKQIKFAIDFRQENIPFNLPNVILINAVHSTMLYSEYIKKLPFDIETPLYEFYKFSLDKNFLFCLKWTIFLGSIDFTVGSNFSAVEQPLKEIINDLKKGEFLFEQCINKLADNHNTFNSIISRNDLFEIVSFFEEQLKKNNQNGVDSKNIKNEIRVLKEDWKDVSKMMSIYSSLTSHMFRQFLTFRWLDLSAGETAFLKLFSRFYTQIDKPSYDRYCILIDEGTSHFHPQWQKEYLATLIEMLPKVLSYKNDTPKIQLLISSHSPFVVSDLPKENILFLNKDKEGYCQVVDGLTDKKQTFGANIHTLLTDTFFMDGLVGDFAEQKINDVIKFLDNKPQDSITNPEQAEAIIKIIGEPILKKYLQKRIDSMKLNRVYDNEKRIELLEKELEKLKNNPKND